MCWHNDDEMRNERKNGEKKGFEVLSADWDTFRTEGRRKFVPCFSSVECVRAAIFPLLQRANCFIEEMEKEAEPKKNVNIF